MTDFDASQRLSELRSIFSDGKYWNHDPSVENDPASVRDIACSHHPANGYCDVNDYGKCGCNCFNNSIQCAGFAYYMAYRVFGTYPRSGADKNNYNGYTDSNGWVYYSKENAAGISLAPGDIIRKNGHSAIVHTVTRNSETGAATVSVAEVWGGVKCKINWGSFNDGVVNGVTDESALTAVGSGLQYIIKAPKNSSGGGGSSTEVEVCFKWNYIGSPSENAYVISYEPGLPYSQKGMPTPTRAGYEFGGWCSDPEGTDIFTSSQPVPNYPHSLYAKWTPLVATVSFKWNYVGAPEENVHVDTYICGLPYSQKGMPTPTREGYEFGGWCSDPEGTDIFTADHPVPIWSHGLYAKWIRCIIVHYMRNRKSDDVNFKYNTCYPGQPFGEMEGYKEYETDDAYYKFKGYYSARSGGTQYTADSIVPNISENILQVYAQWTRVAVVTFVENSVSPDSYVSPLKFPVGEAITVLPAGYVGYRFDGWYTAEIGGTKYINGTIVPAVKNLTLYGHWTRIVNVTLKCNFSESDTSSYSTINAYDGEAYGEALPTSKDRSGYRFDGWFTERSGGTQVTSETLCSDSDHSLYAHWTKVTAVILSDNYSGNSVTVYCPTNEKYGSVLTQNVPVREGCIFDGWYTESGSDGRHVYATSIVPENTVLLYAHWIVKVIFNPCGGCVLGNSILYYDVGGIFGKLPEVCCCEEEKYFDGWYTLPNGYGEKISMITTVPDYSMVLYANWRPEL